MHTKRSCKATRTSFFAYKRPEFVCSSTSTSHSTDGLTRETVQCSITACYTDMFASECLSDLMGFIIHWHQSHWESRPGSSRLRQRQELYAKGYYCALAAAHRQHGKKTTVYEEALVDQILAACVSRAREAYRYMAAGQARPESNLEREIC